MLKLLILYFVMGLTLSCGYPGKRLGGIVDNGNRPRDPEPEPSGEPSQEGPASDAAQVGFDWPVYTLFGGVHTVKLPPDYLKLSSSDNEEKFANRTGDQLLFTKITAINSDCETDMTASNVSKRFYCSANKVQIQAADSDLFQLDHGLSVEALVNILNTFH
jgi:hypothetical protein